jgi:hypothetical protein
MWRETLLVVVKEVVLVTMLVIWGLRRAHKLRWT